ncbi:S8 family serine peptidase [Catellatospora coxensis]|nr:S8 family serine peptidase [Catellatospora coxensis]
MRTVTLVNGDRVTMSSLPGGRSTTVVRGPSGEPVGAHVVTSGADTYVYPDTVTRYVAAGLLDEQLFNITRLVADGYDDARLSHLPLIVEYDESAARRTPLPGATQVRALDSVHSAAVEQDRSAAAGFWSALTAGSGAGLRTTGRPVLGGGVAKVWLDGKVRATLADTTAQIGAPEVWAAGNTGAGVAVAVLDSGVDQTHPDLVGQIAQAQSFVPGEEVADRHGHGTHVASTIAGTGAASQGRERGVAPGVRLHIGKVLSDAGEGQDSWVIAGMEWAARQQHAKVINMSLGGEPTDGTDLKSRAVNELSAETGALFTIAAGNSGPDLETVGTPGAADAALTVAAVDSQDRVAFFSSGGPRRGDKALKPDISAPGVDVLAARSQQSDMGEGPYLTMSGTSMASPHVAGAAALLAAVHPDWTGQQLKDALMSTSRAPQRLEPYRDGSGRVDAAGAVAATLFATGSDFAALTWPHQQSKVDRTITYTNTGDSPVTLSLSLRAPTAPAGLFTLADDRVTVPARGTAEATVQLDLDRIADDNYAYAAVDAAGPDGTRLAHTLVGMNRQGQRADLSFQARDRDGKGLSGVILLKDITRNTIPQLHVVDASGRLDLRLPPGVYSASMYTELLDTDGAYTLGLGMLYAPEIVLAGDSSRTVVLDARKLKRVGAVVKADTARAAVRVDFSRTYGELDPLFDNYLVDSRYHSIWATPTEPVRQGTFGLGFRWGLVEPPLTLSAHGERYDDLLVQTRSGSLPDGSTALEVVYAGDGSAAAVAAARVRGRVAVVRHAPQLDVDAVARTVAAAGGKLMLLVNDGYGRLDAWRDVENPNPALPVASIGRGQGERLIARLGRGPVRHTVTSHPVAGYVYDLVHRYRKAVPADLTYRPQPRDLARVDVDYRNPTPGAVFATRYDVSPEQPGSALSGPMLAAPAQGRRTDWVSADHGNQWFEQASEVQLTLMSDLLTYPPGKPHEVTWFAPVGRPTLLTEGILSGTPTQLGNDVMIWNLPSWGDADPRHMGQVWNAEIDQTTSLHQGGVLIVENPGSSVYGQLTPGGGRVRVTTRTDQQAVSPYSTRTETAWEFPYAEATAEEARRLPLMSVYYAVDTDLAGRADRHAALTVTATHHPDAYRAGKVRTVRLEVSYDDGRTWHRTAVTQRDGGWRAALDAPRSAQFVSVRVTAADTTGNTVTQTVVRAFGLR